MVLAVNAYNEPKRTLDEFVEAKGLKQRILLQGRRISHEKYAVRAYPTTFLINRSGKIVHRDIGFAPSQAAQKETRIKELLSKGKKPKSESEPADS